VIAASLPALTALAARGSAAFRRGCMAVPRVSVFGQSLPWAAVAGKALSVADLSAPI
jgi:hypothetical protein